METISALLHLLRLLLRLATESLSGVNDHLSPPAETITDQEQRDLAEALVSRLREGDDQALAELFSLYNDRLLRLIDFRLDRTLHARVDPVDVLQEAYIDASERVDHFLSRQDASIAVWLRLIVLQRIQLVIRHHLLTGKRDARKEISICGENGSQMFGGVSQLIADSITSPSAALARDEAVNMVEATLQRMSATDRDVLILRHFEQVPNEEVAEILGISVKAASNRYVRALRKLQKLVESIERTDAAGNWDSDSELSPGEAAHR